MRSETRLDSVVFHLTPTRTRCDLVIIANGKTEKIASGLLEPFLAHLKTARDQIAKGGYSITLELDPQTDPLWFTKGTAERFVRFVSTPEVLERVNTIESEILQIEEAISIQGNENLGLSCVEYQQTRPTECVEGSKSTFDADAEKAIVLYKPGSHANPPDSNGFTTKEENSKVQLLRVLETRKTVLQKEQGMAFARAQAAGFDMDQMPHLISFAESFGASRLMEACLQFMELWKGKHESGQWLEVEAAEAISARSEFYSLNASGIILSGDTRKQKEFGEAWPTSELGTENNGKAGDHISAELTSDHLNPDDSKDKRHPSDPQAPLGPHEYFQGQFQHPTFPQWPMHPPPGPLVYQPYAVQGMPYYQSYPGGSPYFQSPYPPMEDPRFNKSQRMGLKRHSMDSKDSNIESDALEMGVSSTRSQDDADKNMSDFEKETSQGRDSRRRHGRSGRKKPSRVVSRNINYITKKRHGASGSESHSTSDSGSETELETEDLHSDALDRKHKHSKSLTKKEGRTKSTETSNAYGNDEAVYRQEADSGNWQAFQSFLLRAEDKVSTVSGDIFAGEKEPPVKRIQKKSEADPILPPQRDSDGVRELRMAEFELVNGKKSQIRPAASHDGFLVSSERIGLGGNQLDPMFKGIESGGGGYRRATSDDFMIYERETQMGSKRAADPLAEHEYEHAANLDKSSLYNVTDESFVVPFRSGSEDQLGADSRTAIDMDSEFPAALQRTENPSNRAKSQLSYEPDDLTLMPERGVENESIGYDPAKDFDTYIHVEDTAILESKNQGDVPTNTKDLPQKSDKEKKLKAPQDRLEKRKKEVIMRKDRSSKLNPLAEAQKRAEKLRAFKVDLQKERKEKEEEDRKRLEALKIERQKRIAARSGSNTAQPPLTPNNNRAQLPPKLSPISRKGSKFSDSEPRSSPLQKLPSLTTSIGSSDSQKTIKVNRSDDGNNVLSRSRSSLPELKKESSGLMSEAKAASIRSKRLSDPKGSSIHHASLKAVSNDQGPKKKMADEPPVKISAIMQLDKNKSATLPELRIRTSTAPSDAVQKLATLQKGTGSNKTTITSESILVKKNNEMPPRFSNIDENPVVEKTVVMLEKEMVPAPVVQASEDIIDIKDRSYGDDISEKTGVDSEFVAIRAPPSPIIVGEVGYNQLNSHEVVIDYSKDEKFSDSSMTEKSYQAPYARATSLEDPATKSLEHSEPSPVSNSEMATLSTEMISKARVLNSADSSSAEQIQQIYDKSRTKESKGFRKLLKFGRKSHNSGSGEGNLDSDGSAGDEGIVSASSSDVPTLKNLISQDDTLGGTPPKVSRPFSLLSPFRSKGVEKQLAA